ncbi:hypothetical protein BCR35DRAFT_307102, partial [Leucosporidium creatinivorum]
APPAQAAQLARPPPRRWKPEETDLLLQLVTKWKSTANGRISWAPVTEQLALGCPPPPGFPPRSSKHVQDNWYMIERTSTRRRSEPEVKFSQVGVANVKGESRSTKKHRISVEDQPFTAQDDADMLNLHRIWPGQLKRIARALLPQRHSKDVSQRLEHLLSRSPSSSTSALLPPSHHPPHHHHQPHPPPNINTQNLFQSLRTQYGRRRGPKVNFALQVESAGGPTFGEISLPARLQVEESFEDAWRALGELSKPWKSVFEE